MIHPVEYLIDLSTNETIHIAEFDPDRILEMQNQSVLEASHDVLEQCTKMPREVIEEAKHGYDTNFKILLRTPPVGALLKLPLPLCSERSVCSLYKISKCTTKNVDDKVGNFPICFESDFPVKTLFTKEVVSVSRDLKSSIIHSWGKGMYVILVG